MIKKFLCLGLILGVFFISGCGKISESKKNVTVDDLNNINDTITNYADPSVYFIKTELLNQCYNLYLFNSEHNVTIGHSWIFEDFLQKCQTKMIEKDVEKAVLKMIDKFNNEKLSEKKINWII